MTRRRHKSAGTLSCNSLTLVEQCLKPHRGAWGDGPLADSASSQMSAIESAIDDMPASLRSSIATAYDFASSLDDDTWREAIETLLRDIKKGGSFFDVDGLAAALRLQTNEVRKLVSGFSATIALLTQTTASAQQFVEAARQKSLLGENGIARALAAATLIADARPDLERIFSRRRLASAVLPTLELFDISVDVRFRFKGDQIEESVPIAVVHIDTDAQHHELWI